MATYPAAFAFSVILSMFLRAVSAFIFAFENAAC